MPEITPMLFAYADPPYLGCCGLYGHVHGDGRYPFDGGCWDDPQTTWDLIGWLSETYPDGWALSCSVPSLRTLLPACPDDVRIGSWVKSFAAFKKGVRPAYAWEPVLFRGGRNVKHPPPEKGGKATTPRDWFSHNILLKKGLPGAKPPAFCDWVMDLLNVRSGDVLDDIFIGTGAMTDAARWRTA